MTIDATFDLSASLGRLNARLDQDASERLENREIARARVPVITTFKSSAVCPTPTAPFVLGMGGPDTGFIFVVRRIIVGGLTWSTTAAGTAEVYITGSAYPSGSTGIVRNLTDMCDQSTALPNKAFYGRDEVVVKEGEWLSVVINGGTAAQQYTANCGVQVVRTTDALRGATSGV